MRVFTAIPLPQQVKDRFSEIMRGRLPVPYVNATNLHVTLNFLGELDSDHYSSVQKLWTEGLPETRKFRIEFDKLVSLNQQIHMTLKPNPELLALQDKLQGHFERMGHKPPHEKYNPHVKVTNLHMDKVMNRERRAEDFPPAELGQLSFVADRIVLFESKLLLHHAKHIILAEHLLT
jgi:2'-5' RNA ligase